MRKLQAIRQAGAIVHDIVLAPLTRDDLEQLIADSLHCEPGHASPLAGWSSEKTTGNPFFAIQFISRSVRRGTTRLSSPPNSSGAGSSIAFTLRVIPTMSWTLWWGSLNRLPAETQKALQQLACLGNSADFAMLRMVYQDSSERDAWTALGSGPNRPDFPLGRFLQVPPRPRAGSGVLPDPRGIAARRPICESAC